MRLGGLMFWGVPSHTHGCPITHTHAHTDTLLGQCPILEGRQLPKRLALYFFRESGLFCSHVFYFILLCENEALRGEWEIPYLR